MFQTIKGKGYCKILVRVAHVDSQEEKHIRRHNE